MKPLAAAFIACLLSLTACGTTATSTAPATSTPTTSPTAAVTTLPDLGRPADNVRVLVPLTRGVGGRGFNGAAFHGKELTIEIACLGRHPYVVRYSGGQFRSACDGTLGQIGDSAVNFKIGSPTAFDLETDGRWEFRVTEAK